jgi:transposase
MNFPNNSANKELPAHRRHDIDDHTWALLEPHLPGRTGAPWRDLPPDYGDWKNAHRRFCRWRDKGLWESLLKVLIDEPDYEWLMIDASHAKVHPHAAGARGGNQAISRTKGDQHQDTSDRGCAWHAASCCYRGYQRRLHARWRIDRGH